MEFRLMIIIFIFIFILICCYLKKIHKFNIKKKAFTSRKLLTFNKKNLNNWMNLTKKERYDISREEFITYSNKRKVLIEEIRKEYKKISKEKSK